MACQLACPQVLTAWERVYRILRDAFPQQQYHRGWGIRGFEQKADEVVVHLGDRGTLQCELLVGADGLRSTVRQQCLPELVPLYAGYVAWRALVPEAAFPRSIHRELFEYMTFCLPRGEQCLGYPVAGADNDLRTGHRRYNVVWYRPALKKTSCSICYGRDRHDASVIDPAAADFDVMQSLPCAPGLNGCLPRSFARSCA